MKYARVCNDIVKGQWRPWCDCSEAQCNLGLCCSCITYNGPFVIMHIIFVCLNLSSADLNCSKRHSSIYLFFFFFFFFFLYFSKKIRFNKLHEMSILFSLSKKKINIYIQMSAAVITDILRVKFLEHYSQYQPVLDISSPEYWLQDNDWSKPRTCQYRW